MQAMAAAPPPWCIGSVFPAQNLLTPQGPFLFDPSDSPQCLLNTGFALNYSYQRKDNPHQQVRNFLSNCIEDFFPEEALLESLQQDVVDIQHFMGNRLEGVQNRGGKIQIFFPVGENNNKVGSFTYTPEFSGPVSSKQKLYVENGKELKCYSSSSSLCQPILQFAADKNESIVRSDFENVPLAVRTLYHVHWMTSQLKQTNNISFASQGSKSFQNCTSHVVWNPHLPGEATVMLENGDMNLFDLRSQDIECPYSVINMKVTMNQEDVICLNQTKYHKNSGAQKGSALGNKHLSFSNSWWSCEYAWHPRNIIVAGRKQIFMVDLRQKFGSKQFCNSLASFSDDNLGLSSYCNQLKQTEYFTSMSRANYDGMYQFAAASTKHLMLYDVRQPVTPLIKWEHQMQHDPPRLLQMYTIAELCSSSLRIQNSSVAGSVILASSYSSGDTHAFYYGSVPHPESYATDSRGSDVKLCAGDNFVSLGLPIKLRNEQAPCRQNIECAFESHDKHLEILEPQNHDLEQISGILNYSPYPGAPNFTMLYLIGKGSIMSQNFGVTEKLEARKSEKSYNASQEPILSRATKRKSETKDFRYQHMPTFIDYIRSGFLPQHIQINKDEKFSFKSISQRGHNIPPSNHDNPEKESGIQSNGTNGVVQSIKDEETRQGDSHNNGNSSFRRLDDGLCSVRLSFEDIDGLDLQEGEFDMLITLKDQFQHWQRGFQHYADYCHSHD